MKTMVHGTCWMCRRDKELMPLFDSGVPVMVCEECVDVIWDWFKRCVIIGANVMVVREK